MERGRSERGVERGLVLTLIGLRAKNYIESQQPIVMIYCPVISYDFGV